MKARGIEITDITIPFKSAEKGKGSRDRERVVRRQEWHEYTYLLMGKI